MRIRNDNPVAVTSIDCIEPGPRGAGARHRRMNVEILRVDSLPAGIDSLIVAGDLQSREIDKTGGCGRLIGCAVADKLAQLRDEKVFGSGERIGALLCGDLYCVPNADRRGGIGDVSDVWRSFAGHFDWVAGVLGNHDSMGAGRELPVDLQHAHLLDGNVVDLDGLSVGGVSGIVGKLSRPNRKDGGTLISLLDRVVSQNPQVALLHESPSCFGGRRGNNAIREYLELAGEIYGEAVPVVLSGHTHWRDPLVTLSGGVQVLNVDRRVFILKP